MTPPPPLENAIYPRYLSIYPKEKIERSMVFRQGLREFTVQEQNSPVPSPHKPNAYCWKSHVQNKCMDFKLNPEIQL